MRQSLNLSIMIAVAAGLFCACIQPSGPAADPESVGMPELRILSPADAPGPGGSGNIDTPPTLATFEPADYPRLARMAGLEGTVTVAVLIDTKGYPSEVTVLRSSGVAAFDDSAVDATLGCEFRPAYYQLRRVACWVAFDYHFQFSSDELLHK